MASLKDIRAKIETTKNTQQITKAMKLVSAAKLRKAQHNITNMRPYAVSLLKLIADVAATNRVSHPLLKTIPTGTKLLLVVISSDRGLCAGFNTNINKFTDTYLKTNKDKHEKIDIIFIGKKSAEFFARKKVKPIETITRLDKDVSYALASGLSDKLMRYFLEGEYDEIKIVYNEFKSAISQQIVAETILPVDLARQTFSHQTAAVPFAADMIYEPAPEKIIDQLLVKHFSVQVYRTMSESVASEHGARMTAMENATNNAREVLNKLTLTYNKVRQEKITTELIEIVSGAEAL